MKYKINNKVNAMKYNNKIKNLFFIKCNKEFHNKL